MRMSENKESQTYHKQVRIRWKHQQAEVDEGLAPLILEIWKHGIDTIMSCQENQPGIAWIDFASAKDAERFLTLVAEYPAKGRGRRKNHNFSIPNVKLAGTLYGRI